jgi:hypothetical protein
MSDEPKAITCGLSLVTHYPSLITASTQSSEYSVDTMDLMRKVAGQLPVNRALKCWVFAYLTLFLNSRILPIVIIRRGAPSASGGLTL